MAWKSNREWKLRRLFQAVALSLLFSSYAPSHARYPLDRERIMGGVRIFYAPQYNLAEIDRVLMGAAEKRLDIAAFILTDRSIIEAIIAAAKRGVKIRLYLDPDQPATRNLHPSSAFSALLATKGVEIRIKTGGRGLMHLKAYHVDGRILRTGAANFSYSGMRHQDNDLIIIESRRLAEAFVSRFNIMWNRQGSRTFPFLGHDR